MEAESENLRLAGCYVVRFICGRSLIVSGSASPFCRN